MKKQFLLFSILLVFITACSDKSWEKAQEEGSIEAYRIYIENNPDAEFAEKAKISLDSLLNIQDTVAWTIAQELDTIVEYEKYILENPEGKFIQEAQEKIDKFEMLNNEINVWNNAKQKNTIEAYESYLSEYQRAEYKYEALKNIYVIKNPEFVEKYKRVFDFFEEIQNTKLGSNTFLQYLDADTCKYNGNIFLPPYSFTKFAGNNSYEDSINLFQTNLAIIFYDEDSYQKVKVNETENGIIIEYPALDIGDYSYTFTWEKENDILVIKELEIWYNGDV